MTTFVWLNTAAGEYFIPTSNITRVHHDSGMNMTAVHLADGGCLFTKESPQSIVERCQEVAQRMLLEVANLLQR